MRKAMSAAIILLAMATGVDAQARSSSQGLSLNLHLNGSALKVEDANDTDTGGGLGLGVGYGITRNIGLFLNVDGASMSSDGDNYRLGHGELGVRYTFLDATAAWRPSLDVSVGARLLQADDVDFDEFGLVDIEMSGPAYNVGGGVAYFFSPALALDMGLRWSFGKFNKIKVDNVTVDLEGDDRIGATSTRLNVGLSWFPGGGRSIHAVRR
jgi:opacity protein-like surface antigen